MKIARWIISGGLFAMGLLPLHLQVIHGRARVGRSKAARSALTASGRRRSAAAARSSIPSPRAAPDPAPAPAPAPPAPPPAPPAPPPAPPCAEAAAKRFLLARCQHRIRLLRIDQTTTRSIVLARTIPTSRWRVPTAHGGPGQIKDRGRWLFRCHVIEQG